MAARSLRIGHHVFVLHSVSLDPHRQARAAALWRVAVIPFAVVVVCAVGLAVAVWIHDDGQAARSVDSASASIEPYVEREITQADVCEGLPASKAGEPINMLDRTLGPLVGVMTYGEWCHRVAAIAVPSSTLKVAGLHGAYYLDNGEARIRYWEAAEPSRAVPNEEASVRIAAVK